LPGKIRVKGLPRVAGQGRVVKGSAAWSRGDRSCGVAAGDRDHTRWPRTKTSDDATVVYWQLD
jgi:hypothetical protein